MGALAKRGGNCQTSRGKVSREDASDRHRRNLAADEGSSAQDAMPPLLWTCGLGGGKMNELFPFYAYIFFQ